MPPFSNVTGAAAAAPFRERARYRSSNLPALREARAGLASRLSDYGRRLLEADSMGQVRPTVQHLMEHLGPDFFTNITLDAQHKRMVKGYMEVKTAYGLMVNRRSVTDFKLQNAIAAGGFDDLPEVGANGEYKLQTIPDESRGSYRIVKHGALFGLTMEAQANDELNVFGERVSKWGAAAARTRDKFVVSDNLDANPVIYDGEELIGSLHANHVTAALSETSLRAGIELFQTQKGIPQPDGTTPDDIQLDPKVLLVNPAQQWLARQLLQSQILVGQGADASPVGNMNTLRGYADVVVSVRVTAGRWYLLADPGQVDMFELGEWNGMSEPEMFAEDPGAAANFDMDVHRWKVRDIFSGTWRDWRGVVGGGFADPH